MDPVWKELARMAGVQPDQWFELFEHIHGDAKSLLPIMDGQRVVLPGERVARAFGREHLPLLTWYGWEAPGMRSIEVAICPHTNHRWWNDPLNRAAAGRFWVQVAQGQGVR